MGGRLQQLMPLGFFGVVLEISRCLAGGLITFGFSFPLQISDMEFLLLPPLHSPIIAWRQSSQNSGIAAGTPSPLLSIRI